MEIERKANSIEINVLISTNHVSIIQDRNSAKIYIVLDAAIYPVEFLKRDKSTCTLCNL